MTTETTAIQLPATTIELQAGERYAGAVLDESGQIKHHLILLADRPEKRANWQKQMTWAASVGGDLPDPQEQALLFANCRDALPEAWCWSNKEHEEDASYAWGCNFYDGNQGGNRKSFEGSAVAVRRSVLESFDSSEASENATSAHACTQAPAGTFTHTYRPAHVSEGKHSYQRRYGAHQDKFLPHPVIAATDPARGEFSVYRDGEVDLAEVRMEIGFRSHACIDLRMTPAELREAAARLLDAAHDIEANPAGALVRHAQEGGAA